MKFKVGDEVIFQNKYIYKINKIDTDRHRYEIERISHLEDITPAFQAIPFKHEKYFKHYTKLHKVLK